MVNDKITRQKLIGLSKEELVSRLFLEIGRVEQFRKRYAEKCAETDYLHRRLKLLKSKKEWKGVDLDGMGN